MAEFTRDSGQNKSDTRKISASSVLESESTTEKAGIIKCMVNRVLYFCREARMLRSEEVLLPYGTDGARNVHRPRRIDLAA